MKTVRNKKTKKIYYRNEPGKSLYTAEQNDRVHLYTAEQNNRVRLYTAEQSNRVHLYTAEQNTRVQFVARRS